MWDPYAEFEKTVLPNGLTVYCAHWPKRPWVAMSFLIHAGASLDKDGLEGTAHFVEHLVSRNSDYSYREIKDHFQNAGGSVSLGGTGYLHTEYEFFAPIEKVHFQKSLQIFGHMLLGSKIEYGVEDQRKVILGEFHRKFPTAIDFQLTRNRNRNVFLSTWLERFVSPMGEPDSITEIKHSDLIEFYNSHYTPSNMSIVCVGGKKLTELVDSLEISPFIISMSGTKVEPQIPSKEVMFPLKTLEVFETSKHIQMDKPMETAQYTSSCILPGEINHLVLSTMCEMLNEVLFEEIREKRGWAYAISADHASYLTFNAFSIHSKGLALEAVDTINDLINGLISSLVERTELFEKIKKRRLTLGQMLDLKAERLRDVAAMDLVIHNHIVTIEEESEIHRKMTIDDVRNTLQWLVPERRYTLIKVP